MRYDAAPRMQHATLAQAVTRHYALRGKRGITLREPIMRRGRTRHHARLISQHILMPQSIAAALMRADRSSAPLLRRRHFMRACFIFTDIADAFFTRLFAAFSAMRRRAHHLLAECSCLRVAAAASRERCLYREKIARYACAKEKILRALHQVPFNKTILVMVISSESH